MRKVPPTRSFTFKVYGTLWVFAGLAAAAYLGLTATLPPSQDRFAGRSDRDAAREVAGLERAVHQLAADVRAVEGKQATSEHTSMALLGRLTNLEEKIIFMPSQAASNIESEPRHPDQLAALPRSSDITTGTIMTRSSAGPSQGPTPPASSSSASLGPAPVNPPGTAVQLATGPNLDALRLSWQLLTERHRELVGRLQTRYRQASGKPNAPYQLIAGPVRTPADASRLCKELAVAGVACRVTTFTGQTL